MRNLVRDVLGSAVTYVLHRARKWLGAKMSTMSTLLSPLGCQDRACCWPDGEFTIAGFEFCERQTADVPADQWAEHTCLLAHETNAPVIVVERNAGGGMAASMLRATWESAHRQRQAAAHRRVAAHSGICCAPCEQLKRGMCVSPII